MNRIDDIITLETNSDTHKLWFNARYLVETNFTFDVAVVSNDFSGKSHFCISKGDLEFFIQDLD